MKQTATSTVRFPAEMLTQADWKKICTICAKEKIDTGKLFAYAMKYYLTMWEAKK